MGMYRKSKGITLCYVQQVTGSEHLSNSVQLLQTEYIKVLHKHFMLYSTIYMFPTTLGGIVWMHLISHSTSNDFR